MSVRRVLAHTEAHTDAARPAFGDVVGDLAGLDAQRAVIDTRDGLVEVALDSIAIARLAPPSTADELALEAVAARGLRPAETGQLGSWQLRAESGFTRRANSVVPLGQPGMPLGEALGVAHEWYAERGLPLRMHVPVEARRLLDAELAERGWSAEPPVHVFAGRLAALRAPSVEAPQVTVDAAPDDAWLALYRGGHGLTDTARALITRHDHAGFASLRMDGRTVAVCRGAIDDGWLGVMALEVDPDYRRRGLATAVMSALWQWAAAYGATRSYLQVWAHNEPAVTLYERLGYWVHHDYHCRTEPDAEPQPA